MVNVTPLPRPVWHVAYIEIVHTPWGATQLQLKAKLAHRSHSPFVHWLPFSRLNYAAECTRCTVVVLIGIFPSTPGWRILRYTKRIQIDYRLHLLPRNANAVIYIQINVEANTKWSLDVFSAIVLRLNFTLSWTTFWFLFELPGELFALLRVACSSCRVFAVWQAFNHIGSASYWNHAQFCYSLSAQNILMLSRIGNKVAILQAPHWDC